MSSVIPSQTIPTVDAAPSVTPEKGVSSGYGNVNPTASKKTDASVGESVPGTYEEIMSNRPFSLETRKKLPEAVEAIHLPSPQKAVVVHLQKLQEEHLKLEEEYRREWNQLKLKYLQSFQPLYESRRAALVQSSAEDKGSLPKTGTPGLPDFWLKAMKNHVLLSEMIVDRDIPVLSYLEDIVFSWVDPNEQASFKLEFFFAPNGFFTNRVLTKTYHLERVEADDEESVLTRTEGTEIQWTSLENNVTKKAVTRRQRNRRTNQTRTITEVVDDNSFFNFFQNHEIPSDDQYDTLEDTELTELEMIIEAEFEVGCILRDKIITHALGWYLGIEKDEEAESIAGSAGDDVQEEYEGDESDDDEGDE